MSAQTREILQIDRLDRQLIHALIVDGRAPFRRLADVLGVSEQTVARRYRRLRDAGAVRVIAIPNPDRYDESWIVRVRIRPSVAVAFGQAVARRPDVAWVALMAGGGEVAFACQARTVDERDALLFERLPRLRQVLEVSAIAMLHRFVGGPETEWHALEDPLDADQLAALRAYPVHGSDGPRPAPADARLLEALAQDGRAGYSALAAHTGDTEARVARRVDTLLRSGAIVIDVDLATERLGYATAAWLWLTVAPAALHAVGLEVAGHPEVSFAAAMSGPANLLVSATTRDIPSLYAYVTGSIAAIDGVTAVDIAPMLRRLKRAGTVWEDTGRSA